MSVTVNAFCWDAVRYHVGAVAWLGESISFLIKSQVILTQTLYNKRLIAKIALQWLSWTILILRLSRHLHAVCCHQNKLVWRYEAIFHPRDFCPTQDKQSGARQCISAPVEQHKTHKLDGINVSGRRDVSLWVSLLPLQHTALLSGSNKANPSLCKL